MTCINLKVHGHALQPADPNNRYKWVCSCGANGSVLPCFKPSSRDRARRNEHDEHKIAVLRAQGKLEDDNA